MLCSFNEIELHHLKTALSFGLEKYFYRVNLYRKIHKAYRREVFKIAYFSQHDHNIKIISVRFSKFFLMDVEENSPFIYYSSIFSDSQNSCNLRESSIIVPSKISHLTTSNCCFQVFLSGSFVNICILRRVCIFKTWVFQKTLNGGCSSAKKGGLILPKMPDKPEILKKINNEKLKIFLLKRGILNKKPQTTNFCEGKYFCEKMTIMSKNDLQKPQNQIQSFIKISKGEIAFSENQQTKFQMSLKIKNIEKIKTFIPKNLKTNDVKCLIVDFNLHERNVSKVFCSHERNIAKFTKELNFEMKKFSSPPKETKPKKNINVKNSHLKSSQIPVKKNDNENFRITFKSNDKKFFTNSQISLGTNAILNEKGEIFMRYEKISNCDICYNPMGIKKIENAGCCIQFQYLSKNYTLCADDKYYKVVYFFFI